MQTDTNETKGPIGARRLTVRDLRLFATLAERGASDPTFLNEMDAAERRTARRLSDFGLAVKGTSECGRRIYYFDVGLASKTMLRYAIGAVAHLRVDFHPKPSTMEAIGRRLADEEEMN